MAPKRNRGESSSSSHSFDRKRFVSQEASLRFHEIMMGRTIIPERGIYPGFIGAQAHLHDMIRERGWGRFVMQPEPAVEAIVREFYANAIEVQNNVVHVRGKEVSFSAATINNYYNTPDLSGLDDYLQYKHSMPNLAEVIKSLCRPDATWTFRGEEPIHFLYSCLSKYGKAWHYFICAKLMPTTHISEVNKERAILLYCLVTGKSINVGLVIHKSIKSSIEGPNSTGLPHPSLICGLCRQAGVEWANNEPIQLPKRLIDEKIIDKLKHWEGAQAHPRGAGYMIAQEQDEPMDEHQADTTHEGPSSPPAPSTTAALTENEFSIKLRRLQSSMDYQFREVARQNEQLARRQDTMYAYQSSFNAALAEQLARLNIIQNVAEMPPPPPLPEYPPRLPRSSEDVDDEDP